MKQEYRSYGKVSLPEESELLAKLDKLPPNFASAKRQAKIASVVSGVIAQRLAERGLEINSDLVERAHLARPMYRHLGIGSSSGIGASKTRDAKSTARTVTSARITAKFLRSKNAQELSEMVAKWYSLGKPAVRAHLKAEDVAFLVGGYMSFGRQIRTRWNHIVYPPSNIPAQNVMVTRLKGPGKLKPAEWKEHIEERKKFLADEYNNGVEPLAKWLESNGVDLRQIALDVNKRVAAGEFDK